MHQMERFALFKVSRSTGAVLSQCMIKVLYRSVVMCYIQQQYPVLNIPNAQHLVQKDSALQ